nr:LamG domain-containing protein [Actinomycetota bacterium]NIX54066.1 hypothetical protein [Actinomycetota bacterium]
MLGGGEEHVLVPHHDSLNIDGTLTISAMVKPENNQWDGIVAKSPSNGGPANYPGNYELRTNNGGGLLEFGFETDPGGGFIFTPVADTALVANEWAHIAFTATAGGTYEYFINGVSAGGGAMDAAFGTDQNTNPLYVGSRADLFTTFNGCMDDLAIFNIHLGADAIETLANQGLSGLPFATDPLNPDTDGDGLLDSVETNTGTFVDANDTGTSP